MGVNTARRALVQKFYPLARRYGVRIVPDTASRKRVETMFRSIVGHSGVSPNHRQEAEDAFAAYNESFHSCAAIPHGTPAQQRRVWKFRAAQLTYNGSAGDWVSKDPKVLKALFDRIVSFIKSSAASLFVAGMSVTLEESLKDGAHVHAHVYVHLDKDYHRQGLDALRPFEFEGIQPHVEPNQASGKAFSGAVRHGHFYVFVDKKGSLFSWANFEPFHDYHVEGWWLDNLLKHEKIEREVYLAYAARVGVCFKRRIDDVRAVERYEREQAMVAHVVAEAGRARKRLKAVKDYPEVARFVSNFTTEMFRRPILAIIGGSNLGKSMLGASVLQRVSAALELPERDNAPSYVEITVEDNEHLDFSDFDVRFHGGVLLDGVGDARILKKNREALQGRPKFAKGAQSATNCHSYKYTLARRAVVASFDLSARNLRLFKTDHWLSNPLNVIQLHLTESVVDEHAPPSVVLPTKSGV